MIDALYSAATGMRAQQTSLDAIANNLANATTTGFKRDRVDLVDLEYVTFTLPSGEEGQVGLGAAPGELGKEHTPGVLQNTARDLDLAIEGPGFFQVTRRDGTLAYTRAGNLQIDASGRLALQTGELLQPRITVPAEATDLSIAANGAVSANVNGELRELGDIPTAAFANPAGLRPVGNSMYAPTVNSGAAQLGDPTGDGRGRIVQGALEASNVNVGTEIISMITTQRAFEAASRVVTASDEMMGIANALRQ
jgi:flagellar basal-body rod protein FlgG